jgi:hypothetical protein
MAFACLAGHFATAGYGDILAAEVPRGLPPVGAAYTNSGLSFLLKDFLYSTYFHDSIAENGNSYECL